MAKEDKKPKVPTSWSEYHKAFPNRSKYRFKRDMKAAGVKVDEKTLPKGDGVDKEAPKKAAKPKAEKPAKVAKEDQAGEEDPDAGLTILQAGGALAAGDTVRRAAWDEDRPDWQSNGPASCITVLTEEADKGEVELTPEDILANDWLVVPKPEPAKEEAKPADAAPVQGEPAPAEAASPAETAQPAAETGTPATPEPAPAAEPATVPEPAAPHTGGEPKKEEAKPVEAQPAAQKAEPLVAQAPGSSSLDNVEKIDQRRHIIPREPTDYFKNSAGVRPQESGTMGNGIVDKAMDFIGGKAGEPEPPKTVAAMSETDRRIVELELEQDTLLRQTEQVFQDLEDHPEGVARFVKWSSKIASNGKRYRKFARVVYDAGLGARKQVAAVETSVKNSRLNFGDDDPVPAAPAQGAKP